MERTAQSCSGGAATRLNIPYQGSLQNPSWSPDGKSILFEASPGDPEMLGTTIWVIEMTCPEAASQG
jgi:Tol biopolymer transport system component